MSSEGSEKTKLSELQEELGEVQNEAAITKEELNSCRECLEKLQELLQVQSHIQNQSDPVLCASSVMFDCSNAILQKTLRLGIRRELSRVADI